MEYGNRIIKLDRWSSLPDSILHLIAKFLNTRIDILRLRAVCKSFRRSLPLPPEHISPHLKIPVPGRGCEVMLSQSTVYAIQPLKHNPHTTVTWFVKLLEPGSGKLKFHGLFDSLPLEYFPEHEQLPKSMNLLDYRVMEVNKEYGLDVVEDDKGLTVRKFTFARRVAVSSSLEIDDKFSIMGMDCRRKNLGVWRKGDKEWTSIDLGFGDSCFDDIVYHNGKFYAFASSDGVTVALDPKSWNISKVADPLNLGPGDNWEKRFVKLSKDLFLVCKHYFCGEYMFPSSNNQFEMPHAVHVFKLDEEKLEWVQEKDSLEDRMWFFGECSFSVSAKEFLGCPRNCVYFENSLSAVILDLADNDCRLVEDFPANYKILWPPPKWLKQDTESMIYSEDSQKEEVEKANACDPKGCKK